MTEDKKKSIMQVFNEIPTGRALINGNVVKNAETLAEISLLIDIKDELIKNNELIAKLIEKLDKEVKPTATSTKKTTTTASK